MMVIKWFLIGNYNGNEGSGLNSEDDSTKVKQEKYEGFTRRNVLQTTITTGAVTGALPMFGNAELSKGESQPISDENKGALKSVYSTAEVKKLQDSYPDMNLDPVGIHSMFVNSESEIIAASIRVADGILTFLDVHGTTTAIMTFDEHRPDIANNWPLETNGLIKATLKEAQFVRTPTDDELKRILDGIGETKLTHPTDTDVYIIPESSSFLIEKIDYNNRMMELIEGSSKINGEGERSEGFNIDNKDMYGNQQQMRTNATDDCDLDGEFAANVFICLTHVETCSRCSPTLLGGPKPALACLLLVCFGSVAAVEAVLDQLDMGCSAAVGQVIPCWDAWTDYY